MHSERDHTPRLWVVTSHILLSGKHSERDQTSRLWVVTSHILLSGKHSERDQTSRLWVVTSHILLSGKHSERDQTSRLWVVTSHILLSGKHSERDQTSRLWVVTSHILLSGKHSERDQTSRLKASFPTPAGSSWRRRTQELYSAHRSSSASLETLGTVCLRSRSWTERLCLFPCAVLTVLSSSQRVGMHRISCGELRVLV